MIVCIAILSVAFVGCGSIQVSAEEWNSGIEIIKNANIGKSNFSATTSIVNGDAREFYVIKYTADKRALLAYVDNSIVSSGGTYEDGKYYALQEDGTVTEQTKDTEWAKNVVDKDIMKMSNFEDILPTIKLLSNTEFSDYTEKEGVYSCSKEKIMQIMNVSEAELGENNIAFTVKFDKEQRITEASLTSSITKDGTTTNNEIKTLFGDYDSIDTLAFPGDIKEKDYSLFYIIGAIAGVIIILWVTFAIIKKKKKGAALANNSEQQDTATQTAEENIDKTDESSEDNTKE